MEILTENSGLIHIGERILKNLDLQTHLNCRWVKGSWKCILDKDASKTDLDSLLNELKKQLIVTVSLYPPDLRRLSKIMKYGQTFQGRNIFLPI